MLLPFGCVFVPKCFLMIYNFPAQSRGVCCDHEESENSAALGFWKDQSWFLPVEGELCARPPCTCPSSGRRWVCSLFLSRFTGTLCAKRTRECSVLSVGH